MENSTKNNLVAFISKRGRCNQTIIIHRTAIELSQENANGPYGTGATCLVLEVEGVNTLVNNKKKMEYESIRFNVFCPYDLINTDLRELRNTIQKNRLKYKYILVDIPEFTPSKNEIIELINDELGIIIAPLIINDRVCLIDFINKNLKTFEKNSYILLTRKNIFGGSSTQDENYMRFLLKECSFKNVFEGSIYNFDFNNTTAWNFKKNSQQHEHAALCMDRYLWDLTRIFDIGYRF